MYDLAWVISLDKNLYLQRSSYKKRDTYYTENLFPFSFDVETNHSDIYPS